MAVSVIKELNPSFWTLIASGPCVVTFTPDYNVTYCQHDSNVSQPAPTRVVHIAERSKDKSIQVLTGMYIYAKGSGQMAVTID